MDLGIFHAETMDLLVSAPSFFIFFFHLQQRSLTCSFLARFSLGRSLIWHWRMGGGTGGMDQHLTFHTFTALLSIVEPASLLHLCWTLLQKSQGSEARVVTGSWLLPPGGWNLAVWSRPFFF